GDDCGCPRWMGKAKKLRDRRENSDERHAESELDDRCAACSAHANAKVGDEEHEAAEDRAHEGAFPVPPGDDVSGGMTRQFRARLANRHSVAARFIAIIRAKAMMVHEGATPQAVGKRLASAT